LILPVAAFLYSIEQSQQQPHKFCVFRVQGVNCQFFLVFFTCNKKLCLIWPSVTVAKQKECMPIFPVHTYLYPSSNKRICEQFRYGQITCDNNAYNTAAPLLRSIV